MKRKLNPNRSSEVAKSKKSKSNLEEFKETPAYKFLIQ